MFLEQVYYNITGIPCHAINIMCLHHTQLILSSCTYQTSTMSCTLHLHHNCMSFIHGCIQHVAAQLLLVLWPTVVSLWDLMLSGGDFLSPSAVLDPCSGSVAVPSSSPKTSTIQEDNKLVYDQGWHPTAQKVRPVFTGLSVLFVIIAQYLSFSFFNLSQHWIKGLLKFAAAIPLQFCHKPACLLLLYPSSCNCTSSPSHEMINLSVSSLAQLLDNAILHTTLFSHFVRTCCDSFLHADWPVLYRSRQIGPTWPDLTRPAQTSIIYTKHVAMPMHAGSGQR